jgi:hypothetical protein
MRNVCLLAIGLFVLMPTAAQVAFSQDKKPDPLQPLLFLDGTWHGEGKGPCGAYEFETKVERRGRWLLLTSDVFVSKSDKLMFVSTQVYGYDDKGLVLQLFDTAGAFQFRGEAKDKTAHFEWKDGERYKRIDMRIQDGKIHSRYDALEPALFKDPVSFEGVWLPGERPKKKR